jgi:hypothetical protein
VSFMSSVFARSLAIRSQRQQRCDIECNPFDRHFVKPISIQALQDLLNEYGARTTNSAL